MTKHVTLIPGDGIGPSISGATVKILAAAGADIEWDTQVAAMAGVALYGDTIPDSTLDSIKRTKLALKGLLETPVGEGFRSINARCEKHSICTRTCVPRIASRLVVLRESDLVLIRENTEGLYVGVEHYIKIGDDPRAAAESVAIITRIGSERIVRYAFDYAVRYGRKKVTLVHKANILKFSQGLFLDTGRMVARDYAGRIEFDERIVDAMAMNLVLHPERFDVICTTNLFGDILSDEISDSSAARAHARANIGANGAIRSRARLGAGHRGEGHRQSVGARAGGVHAARAHR